MNPLLPAAVQRNLILASRSPRRSDILSSLAIDFKVVPAARSAEKSVVTEDPWERPLESARLKAQNVARKHPDATVVAADTVVIVDDHALGKPKNDAEARDFLQKLSGRAHHVVTGVAVYHHDGGVRLLGCEDTAVRFRSLTDDEIRSYVATGEGKDKAGAYAVQGVGAALVRSIDGCYYNIVGLPVELLFNLLKRV